MQTHHAARDTRAAESRRPGFFDDFVKIEKDGDLHVVTLRSPNFESDPLIITCDRDEFRAHCCALITRSIICEAYELGTQQAAAIAAAMGQNQVARTIEQLSLNLNEAAA